MMELALSSLSMGIIDVVLVVMTITTLVLGICNLMHLGIGAEEDPWLGGICLIISSIYMGMTKGAETSYNRGHLILGVAIVVGAILAVLMYLSFKNRD